MRILISGGSGFLGRALSARLLQDGAEVAWISRDPGRAAPVGIKVLGYGDLQPSLRFDAVLNLAGAGIADRRWSDRRRQVLVHVRPVPYQLHWNKYLVLLHMR